MYLSPCYLLPLDPSLNECVHLSAWVQNNAKIQALPAGGTLSTKRPSQVWGPVVQIKPACYMQSKQTILTWSSRRNRRYKVLKQFKYGCIKHGQPRWEQYLDQIDIFVFHKHSWTSVFAAYHQLSATTEGSLTISNKNKMRISNIGRGAYDKSFHRAAPSYLAWMSASWQLSSFNSMLWCCHGNERGVRTGYLHHPCQLHTAGNGDQCCAVHLWIWMLLTSAQGYEYQQCWLDDYDVTLGHSIKSGNKLLSVFSIVNSKGQGNAAGSRLNLSFHEALVSVWARSHLLLL